MSNCGRHTGNLLADLLGHIVRRGISFHCITEVWQVIDDGTVRDDNFSLRASAKSTSKNKIMNALSANFSKAW